MSAASPKISIVITCYNYARYVAAAIDSALGQTYPNIEIIAVDDGSTDGSAEILARYSGRVKCLRQENQGQAAAGFLGFNESSGDIVIFLDADDLLKPEAAAEVARVWRKDCVKVQYDLAIINAAGEDLGRRFCNFVPSYDEHALRKDFAAHGIYLTPVMSGNAYSRWYLKTILPITSTRVLDGILNTVAPVYGPILTLPKPLGCYRLHNANFSSRGEAEAANLSRFGESMGNRNKELQQLREHAVRQNVALPKGYLLDNDIIFINYRMMMKKINVSYENSSKDTVLYLLRRAFVVLITRPMPLKLKMAHMLWFGVLSIAPRYFARVLISLRYSRANYFLAIRSKMSALLSIIKRPSMDGSRNRT